MPAMFILESSNAAVLQRLPHAYSITVLTAVTACDPCACGALPWNLSLWVPHFRAFVSSDLAAG